MINVEQLAKSYGSVQALKGISFSVQKGEIIGLLGPNGAGKTTAMKILTGYLQPTEGTAKVADIDVVDDPIGVQRLIGYLPENAPIYLDMSVQDYLMMMADLRQIPDNKRRALISEAVHSTQLESKLTTTIGDLSKGFRQRVGLAQAIMHKPQLLILDEPTNGLDPTQIAEVRALIKRIAETSTVILSTHILTEVEATCERAIIIINGEIKADNDLRELTQSAGAIVDLGASDSNVEGQLREISGVKDVVPDSGAAPDFKRWRVTAESPSICQDIFEVAKQKDWKLAELRPDQRTLESVFRDLAHREGVSA